MIGQDFDMKMPNIMDAEAYEEFIDDVVERFKFDVDDFKERLIKAIMNGIKIELKLK